MKKRMKISQRANMLPKVFLMCLLIFVLFAVFPLSEDAETGKVARVSAVSRTAVDIAELPCIPAWAKEFAAPVNGTYNRTYTAAAEQTPPPPRYWSLTQLQITSDVFCTYFDKATRVTRIFAGDYPNDRIIVSNIKKDLSGYSQILDIPYGLTWLVKDLDRDGNVELIIQRGDPGFGGNGYLDIHSAPNWELRTRIVLTGMKVYFYPLAVNLDSDSYLELYLSPSSLGGNEHAMVVHYDPKIDEFVVTDDLAAPSGHYGQSTAADFDADGEVEIITGNNGGYGLFWYGGGGITSEYYGLHYKGLIEDAIPGHWATSCRPKPDELNYALLGSSSFAVGYTYQLLKPTGGDDAFVIDHTFNENTGYAGIHPSFAMDDDNDGLDEISMGFHPTRTVYEWNTYLGQFVSVWNWYEIELGTFVRFAAADIDQDGLKEWCWLNHLELLRFYERQDVY